MAVIMHFILHFQNARSLRFTNVSSIDVEQSSCTAKTEAQDERHDKIVITSKNVDRFSRIAMPVAFAVFNVVYWVTVFKK